MLYIHYIGHNDVLLYKVLMLWGTKSLMGTHFNTIPYLWPFITDLIQSFVVGLKTSWFCDLIRKWDKQGRPSNALWDAPVSKFEQKACHRYPGRRHQNRLSGAGRNTHHCHRHCHSYRNFHILWSHQNSLSKASQDNKQWFWCQKSFVHTWGNVLSDPPQDFTSVFQKLHSRSSRIRNDLKNSHRTSVDLRRHWRIEESSSERESSWIWDVVKRTNTYPSRSQRCKHTHTTQRWHLLPLKDENMWWKFKICYFLLHYNLRAYSIYINQSVLEVLFQQWHQSMYLLSKLWYQGCLKIRSDYWIELCRSIKHKKAWNVTNFRLYNSKILQVPQTLWGLLSN